MSTHRYPGGVISATPPTASSSSAVGVWTLEEALRNKQAGNWPDGAGTDPYFKNVTLLLHGDGTNGAQNNTFLDSSTNNFTITRNGNTTQGSFDPYVGPGCWSDFYAATSSGWQTPASSITSILGGVFNASSTFTVEAWIYPIARHSGGGAAQGYVFGSMALGGGQIDWSFGPDSNGKLTLFWYNSASYICNSTNTVPLNTWTHIAVSISSGSIKMFINGVQETLTGTTTTTTTSGTALTYVSSGGYLYAGTTWQGFNGYISNLRVIGKRAVYTSTFTPSTTPLVATTDTTLLVNNSASLVDQSAGGWTLTATGGVQISKFSPFSLYQITPASYSGYFDGTGDYLTVPASSALTLGAGDFTVECWVYTTLANQQYGSGIFGTYDVSGGTSGWSITINRSSAPGPYGIMFVASGAIAAGYGTYLSVGTWYHIAVTRSGSTLRVFLNGSQVATATYSTNDTAATTCYIGSQGVGQYHTGSISNVRMVKGQALYTSTFTPSTSPLTTTSQGATAANVSLLTCQSTTFIDNSTNAFAITVNGNATPKVANPFTDTVSGPTAYGASANGGSGYFDGTGDYLSTPSSAAFSFGTGDFTVECWFNLSSLGVYRRIWWFSDDNDNTNINASNQVQFGGASQTAITGSTINANTWYHLAYVRSSGSGKLYLNGAQVGSTTANAYNSSSRSVYIGATSTGTNPFLGYISNLRVVKGTAVYTGPFVPPAAPVTAITNTQLLLNMTNGGIFDNSTVNDLETGGSAQISTSVVKYGTGSMSFNGTNSYLYAINNTALQFATGDYTVEFWAYVSSFSTTPVYTDFRTSNGATGGAIQISATTGGIINVYGGSSTATLLVTAGSALTTSTWYHVALTRASGATKLFINGTQSGSTYASDTTSYGLGALWIGSNAGGGGNYLNGYLDDIRVTKGYARYTANFTPPGGPFPNI